ncbi:MAG: RagB/SusD family nutrient uptake outer membrane protein [Candidatus Pseudobacter hemicellulosilyticus]|uniref:RagB/SusD family nutrient uptake outer membrane protein n=1 Tax=Candidatus Pseudobacter hemicellulosilyticus TaxID=3121375 RepID=A0AAJ6BG30_9BACT|nr:MAG: RagB/SusD family nutrient uptake outer membrane protein [Pseudobacter sp.]
MKNNLLIPSLIIAILLSTGCKKYLDLPAKNERTVTTVNDIRTLLASYLKGVAELRVKPLYGNVMCLSPNAANLLFEAYSDNIDFETALTQTYLQPNNYHLKLESGYANLLLWNDQTTPNTIWSQHYEIIGFLNSLIDQMEEITDATEQQRDQLLGELHAHRAYYFLKLLQYFGPYHKADQGIPVYLHTGQGVLGITMARKTHAEVYQVILDDLNKSLTMINRTAPLVGFNVFYDARRLHHLAAQVYWFKAESPAKEAGDYEQLLTHAAAAAEGTAASIPQTATDMINAYGGRNPAYPGLCQENNSQGAVSPLFGSCYQYLSPGTYGPEDIPLSAAFAGLFTPGDVRISAIFNMTASRAGGKVGVEGKTLNWAWPSDGTTSGSIKRGNICVFKPEEAWLFLAEAQYRLNKPGDAIATLNTFKGLRNAGTADGLSGDALLQEIINERRKEFFGDTDKRWLDLKRYRPGTITRTLTFFQKEYQLSVGPDDYRYALQIPLSELAENPAMVPNDGWIPIEY